MKNIFQINTAICIALLALSCSSSETEQVVDTQGPATSETIQINTSQFEKMGLVLGNMESTTISEAISANGMVDVPPENIAEVSYPTNGFIKTLTHNVLPGKYVTKGSVLATAQSMEVIQLQQDCLEKYNLRLFLAQELERQKAMIAENAGAQKLLQQAEGNYKVNQSLINSFEAKLNLLGLPIEKIRNGEITQQIGIRAPFSGFVQKVNVHTGTNFSPNDVLFELISKEHLHVELKVFEKDANKVKEGQTVVFNDPKIGGIVEGKVFLVGKNFESDTKAINVHVHLSDEKAEQMMIPGQYLNGKIMTDSRQAMTLPEAAVIKEGERSYVFVQKSKEGENLSFEKIEVSSGNNQNGLVEILSPQNLVNVVLSKVNFLAAGFEEE
jgi:membrane fusion protein, heavy metal efflux system